ncbi:similar to Saccharomyces cerevisiae YPL088W Putative aryl alcohol dehydrogenase [Maudiozyma saulgeensis]|uniref:Similar to Saccharomyces cerevisiae YPL088W Putative aryl alcohol dehydrogenase n=1 Tax=Maudiozyma saulgeensis TaxID=1789683 RepID=A0A1X7R810_9SACH|nr:similar to Saccharomyces cerevisiae YPL088W Putative aryl alcohol dehydrogenase [Kazachstania saulgeensis]
MSSLAKQVQFGNTGIKISPIIVGCMSFGSKKWAPWVEDDKEKVFTILKHCYDRGLRTFDTSDTYSNGASERLLGEFLRNYNIKRETVVIMTKVFGAVDETLDLPMGRYKVSEKDLFDITNQQGLSRKHILVGVQNSVERLGTYIDVLQVHRFDNNTPITETMRALNDVVERGDVRYIGASSMLPTQFVEMQATSDKHGWHQFVNIQSCYNLIYREDERDLYQYCAKHKIARTPWSPNAMGVLCRPLGDTTDRAKTDKALARLGFSVFNKGDEEILQRVELLAKKKNVSMAAVSVAWVIAKGAQPIVGMSSVERVDDTLLSLDVTLNNDELKYLEEPYTPRNFIY